MPADRALARLFASQHGLVTRAQALARGLSSHGIDHRLRIHRWERVHAGVYRLVGSPVTWHQKLLAACLAAGKGAVASHRAAGALWGFPIGDHVIEVTIPERRRVVVPGIILHRAVALSSADVRRVEGIPVTGAPRTVMDLAGVLDRLHLERILDHALADRMVSARTLANRLAMLGTRGRAGWGQLADLVAARATAPRAPESLFEARLARVLRSRGLPVPLAQFRVRLPSGRWARLDFAYPEALVAIEADSYRYHSSLAAWSRERTRNNQLIALGWRVLPITYRDLSTDPDEVADQVMRCLASASPHQVRRIFPP